MSSEVPSKFNSYAAMDKEAGKAFNVKPYECVSPGEPEGKLADGVQLRRRPGARTASTSASPAAASAARACTRSHRAGLASRFVAQRRACRQPTCLAVPLHCWPRDRRHHRPCWQGQRPQGRRPRRRWRCQCLALLMLPCLIHFLTARRQLWRLRCLQGGTREQLSSYAWLFPSLFHSLPRCSRPNRHVVGASALLWSPLNLFCSQGKWPVDGSITQGGYADYHRSFGRFAVPIPEGLSDEVAAPMLCG
jgi:hypothetical protein